MGSVLRMPPIFLVSSLESFWLLVPQSLKSLSMILPSCPLWSGDVISKVPTAGRTLREHFTVLAILSVIFLS